MAEIKPEEGKINEGDDAEEETGKSKSKLIIIITAAVLVLLIAGGAAYFFLFSSEEPDEPPLENGIEAVDTESEATEDNILEESSTDAIEEMLNDMPPEKESMAVQMGLEEPAAPEEEDDDEEVGDNLIDPESSSDIPITNSTDIENEKRQMSQEIEALKAQINEKEKIIQTQRNKLGSNASPESTERVTSTSYSGEYSDDYSNYYQDDEAERLEAMMRGKNQTPPPKPSWDEFKRLNK